MSYLLPADPTKAGIPGLTDDSSKGHIVGSQDHRHQRHPKGCLHLYVQRSGCRYVEESGRWRRWNGCICKYPLH